MRTKARTALQLFAGCIFAAMLSAFAHAPVRVLAAAQQSDQSSQSRSGQSPSGNQPKTAPGNLQQPSRGVRPAPVPSHVRSAPPAKEGGSATKAPRQPSNGVRKAPVPSHSRSGASNGKSGAGAKPLLRPRSPVKPTPFRSHARSNRLNPSNLSQHGSGRIQHPQSTPATKPAQPPPSRLTPHPQTSTPSDNSPR